MARPRRHVAFFDAVRSNFRMAARTAGHYIECREKAPLKNTALEAQNHLSDLERARLRVLVSVIDRKLAGGKLSDGERPRQTDELTASWDEVVRLLALGRAPEIRDCPTCGNVGMRAARLCGYCWEKLPSLPPA
jgi:hypothetical protein